VWCKTAGDELSFGSADSPQCAYDAFEDDLRGEPRVGTPEQHGERTEVHRGPSGVLDEPGQPFVGAGIVAGTRR
jgi:hypothetical protein